MTRTPLALTLLAAFLPMAAAPALAQYKILRTLKVGGDGGFDYVTADPANRALYVARSGPAGHIGVFNVRPMRRGGRWGALTEFSSPEERFRNLFMPEVEEELATHAG